MGLTTWKNSPKGKVLKGDIMVAKNYLNEQEVTRLNLLVREYLSDFDHAFARYLKGGPEA
jgi:hypothetical protein